MNAKGLLKAQSAPKVLRFYESLTYGDLFKGNGFSKGRDDLGLWYFEKDEKQSHKRQDDLVYFIRNN